MPGDPVRGGAIRHVLLWQVLPQRCRRAEGRGLDFHQQRQARKSWTTCQLDNSELTYMSFGDSLVKARENIIAQYQLLQWVKSREDGVHLHAEQEGRHRGGPHGQCPG